MNTRVEWTEEQAQADLAVRHYPGKWEQAKRLALDRRHYGGEYEDISYWERVRYLYLELGGLYVGQLNPQQQYVYFQTSTAFRA